MEKSRLLRTWVLAAGLAALLTGCKDDETGDRPEGNAPAIEFALPGIEVGAEGGIRTLAYEITGSEKAGTLTAEADDGWVHSFDASEKGILRFTVDANDTGAERSTVVRANWPGADEVELGVKQSAGAAGLDWTLDVKIENYEVTLDVTPSDDSQAYYADIQYLDFYESKGLSPKEFAESVIEEMVEYYATVAEMTREEVIENMMSYGPVSIPYGVITPGTKYIAYAFALNAEGEVLSDVKIEQFETPPAVPSDNRISIEVDNITAVTADVRYTTTNDDVYLFDVVPAAELEGLTDEEFMTGTISRWAGYIGYALATGNHDYHAEYLEPDTDYVAVAFGYDVLTYTTGLTKKPFRTSPPGDPGKCTFAFEIEAPKPGNIMVAVTPSDPTVRYFWNLYEATATADDIREIIEESIRTNTENGYYEDVLEYWRNESSIGPDSYLFMGMDPEGKYRAAAVALDMKTGAFAGEFFLSEVFPEDGTDDLSIEVICDKYFDGDEAAALGGEYAGFAGKALVPLSVEVEGAGDYRWAVTEYPGDYENASDKSFWSAFSWEEIFFENEPAGRMALEWDKDYTLVAMARNAEGDAYRRFMKSVRFTKEGASPIGELTPAALSAGAAGPRSVGFRPLGAERSDGPAAVSESARRAEWKARAAGERRSAPAGCRPFGRIAGGR